MKVLWLCNTILPRIAHHIGMEIPSRGGWMFRLADELAALENMSLTVCFPVLNADNPLQGEDGDLSYMGFPQRYTNPAQFDSNLESILKKFISELEPDVIHIWGTEYTHTLSLINACCELNISDKTVISIQGLCSVYARHFYAELPVNVVYGFSLRDIIKRDNIYFQKKNFLKRGIFEIQALKRAAHIIGRTDWDCACAQQINRKARYHFCNEILRDIFYEEEKWSIEHCERYSIFVSQGNYPIKGLHYVIEALEIIIQFFPQAHLYVAGTNITDKSTFKKRLKKTGYGKYIDNLISKKALRQHITFLGNLNEADMHSRYVKSHVFVSASSIENSPNSVGEAMISGVPIVSSDVGGVKNMMAHNVDGFIYQSDAAYMLAHYVCKIFENDELALEFSESAKKRAAQTHDREQIIQRILEIYQEISSLEILL